MAEENYLDKEYRFLPQRLKDAMFSPDSSEAIFNIGVDYELDLDQIRKMADEIARVLLGFTHPSQFAENLNRLLEVDWDTTMEIVEALYDDVLCQYSHDLQEAHGSYYEREDFIC